MGSLVKGVCGPVLHIFIFIEVVTVLVFPLEALCFIVFDNILFSKNKFLFDVDSCLTVFIVLTVFFNIFLFISCCNNFFEFNKTVVNSI